MKKQFTNFAVDLRTFSKESFEFVTSSLFNELSSRDSTDSLTLIKNVTDSITTKFKDCTCSVNVTNSGKLIFVTVTNEAKASDTVVPSSLASSVLYSNRVEQDSIFESLDWDSRLAPNVSEATIKENKETKNLMQDLLSSTVHKETVEEVKSRESKEKYDKETEHLSPRDKEKLKEEKTRSTRNDRAILNGGYNFETSVNPLDKSKRSDSFAEDLEANTL